jgi:hypothetical protein
MDPARLGADRRGRSRLRAVPRRPDQTPRHSKLDLNRDLLAGCTLGDRASRSLELRRRDERSFAAFKVSMAL